MNFEDVIKQIPKDAKIVLGHAVGNPDYLIEKLCKYRKHFKNAEIYHMITYRNLSTLNYPKNFRHKVIFIGTSREAINKGTADYLPINFSEVPSFIEKLEHDLALVQVANNKNWNLGVSWDYTYEAVEKSKFVIAQRNRYMPSVYHNREIDKIDAVIDRNENLYELKWRVPDTIDKKIAENIIPLIGDWATLQIGNGAIPDRVAELIDSNVFIHSEMIGNWYKTLLRRKKVFGAKGTFIAGTSELYKLVNKNPELVMDTVDEINGIHNLMKINNLISINSAISVDLYGQVCSETIGSKEYSGVGGQVDFVRGTRLSRNGRSIIALRSQTKSGISKIVPKADSVVTTTRSDVDIIVTEYGVADLRYKTVEERKESLIKIAHPSIRKKLKR